MTASIWTPPTRKVQGIVATRGACGTNSANNTFAARTFHYATDDIDRISIAFAAWHVNAGTEADSGGPVTVEAAIEYPWGSSNFYPLRKNGSRVMTVANGLEDHFDFVGIPRIPRGSMFGVRQRLSGNLGYADVGLRGYVSGTAGDALEATATDKTTSGTVTDGFGGLMMYPLAVLGITDRPGGVILGDSIQTSLGDGTGDATGDRGTIARGMAREYGYMHLASVSETYSSWASASQPRRLRAAKKYGAWIACGLGANDSGSGTAALQGYARSVSAQFGPRAFYQGTITPNSTSGGGWVDPAGADQTAVNAANIDGFNAWLRAGADGNIAGHLEIADYVALAGGVGKWKAPGYTIDGLHPSTLACQAVVMPRGRIVRRNYYFMPSAA